MSDERWLTDEFDARRARLKSIARRLLGSESESDDALQEAWLRASRAETRDVQNVGGWLTTIVARVCIDALRARNARREVSHSARRATNDAASIEPIDERSGPREGRDEPAVDHRESEIVLAETIGSALMVVSSSLAPAERVAFVLHDIFDLPFEEIAVILERSPAATRQLASRARRRVRGGAAPTDDSDPADRALVHAFLAASREGNFERLLAVLSPDAVLRADALAVQRAAQRAEHGAPRLVSETRGAREVATIFEGRARGAAPAWIDGAPGAVWTTGAVVHAAFVFAIEDGAIVEVQIVMAPAALAMLEIELA